MLNSIYPVDGTNTPKQYKQDTTSIPIKNQINLIMLYTIGLSKNKRADISIFIANMLNRLNTIGMSTQTILARAMFKICNFASLIVMVCNVTLRTSGLEKTEKCPIKKINTPKTKPNTKKRVWCPVKNLSRVSILKVFTHHRNHLRNSTRLVHMSVPMITEILNATNQNQNVGV